MSNIKTVTITLDRYNELLNDQAFLDALHSAGVDNWEGYDIAHDIFSDQG